MVKYVSENQLSIEEFKTPFRAKLSPENRWVKLSQAVPWDKFASAYMSMMNKGFGRPGVSLRVVLGALINKHLKNLDGRGVIKSVQENIYMQYFVGLKEFTNDPVFDFSSFVEIRKRVGYELFDTISMDMIRLVSEKIDSKPKKRKKMDDGDEAENKRKMQADATVADQDIAYPTDNGILNESMKKCEKMIDKLYEADGKQGIKPRTYRRTMNSTYLDYSKKKKKSKATHRKMTRKQAKATQSYYQRRKARKEAAERNHIEGKFGQGKNGYNLNEIRARLSASSESWVACIFFVMNMINFQTKDFLCSFFRWIMRWMDQRLLISLSLEPYLNQNPMIGTNTIPIVKYYKMVC